jgi:hypothetical protein
MAWNSFVRDFITDLKLLTIFCSVVEQFSVPYTESKTITANIQLDLWPVSHELFSTRQP